MSSLGVSTLPDQRPVNDQYYSGCPECDARQEWAVTQQHLGGAPAPVFSVDQIEVAKDAVDLKRQGPR